MGGSKGGGDIYDYFKKDGKKTRGDAVASNDDSNAGDWSDFGNRRNLVSRDRLRAGLFSDEEDLSSENESGRQEKEEKSMKKKKKKMDKIKGTTKQKIKEMKKEVKKA